MKRFAIVALMLALAVPASAANWNESINGDLSSNPGAPTLIAFGLGVNTVQGSTIGGDRDFLRFNVPANQALVNLNLVAFGAPDLAFTAFNAGTTSFVPGISTSPLFLAGIHISAAEVGQDLMPLYVCCSVTTYALAAPNLGPGDYCFVIQQTNATPTPYTLEFVMQGIVSTEPTTWGSIKALYR